MTNDTEFQLSNPPQSSEPKPVKFFTEKARQSVLFSGLDCLPGQQDLFPTDGPSEDWP